MAGRAAVGRSVAGAEVGEPGVTAGPSVGCAVGNLIIVGAEVGEPGVTVFGARDGASGGTNGLENGERVGNLEVDPIEGGALSGSLKLFVALAGEALLLFLFLLLKPAEMRAIANIIARVARNRTTLTVVAEFRALLQDIILVIAVLCSSNLLPWQVSFREEYRVPSTKCVLTY